MHGELPGYAAQRRPGRHERLRSRRIDPVLRGPADVPALRAGSTDPSDHPLTDEVALELGDGGEHV
jgi:hypothetical protein